jgi:hypothetical protein
MPTYHLQISEPRPYFAELPYYLWGEVNYDSDGDCSKPTDRGWTNLYLKNRETGDVLDFDSNGVDWTVSGSDPHAKRAAFFLVHRCLARPAQALELVADDPDHREGLRRAQRVASEFEALSLKPFDTHLFWGSWKWIGWFATDFTWVGRWIMHSVVRKDPRAVSLCIDWLRQGPCSEVQSAALRYALGELTGTSFDTDGKWLNWYDGGMGAAGQKDNYPEPDFDAWLADLKTQSNAGS